MPKTRLIGYCGVDSGQIMLTDPCYAKDFIDNEEFAPTTENHPYSYNGACGATLNTGDKQGGELGRGLGVVIATAHGDGSYPVYAEYDHWGNLVSATIYFDGQQDHNDECQYCGESESYCSGDCQDTEDDTDLDG